MKTQRLSVAIYCDVVDCDIAAHQHGESKHEIYSTLRSLGWIISTIRYDLCPRHSTLTQTELRKLKRTGGLRRTGRTILTALGDE